MAQIAARVSDKEKEELLQYCKDRGMNITGLIRIALKEFLKETDIMQDKD